MPCTWGSRTTFKVALADHPKPVLRGVLGFILSVEEDEKEKKVFSLLSVR